MCSDFPRITRGLKLKGVDRCATGWCISTAYAYWPVSGGSSHQPPEGLFVRSTAELRWRQWVVSVGQATKSENCQSKPDLELPQTLALYSILFLETNSKLYSSFRLLAFQTESYCFAGYTSYIIVKNKMESKQLSQYSDYTKGWAT
jgi:hypothetical protein